MGQVRIDPIGGSHADNGEAEARPSQGTRHDLSILGPIPRARLADRASCQDRSPGDPRNASLKKFAPGGSRCLDRHRLILHPSNSCPLRYLNSPFGP